jgi:hypothetical protein
MALAAIRTSGMNISSFPFFADHIHPDDQPLVQKVFGGDSWFRPFLTDQGPCLHHAIKASVIAWKLNMQRSPCNKGFRAESRVSVKVYA